jgi:choline kinase
MKAIILAAGEGKRLRPLTNDSPKCMVKLFGKSILQRQIEIFTRSGITDISVITGYRSDKIQIPSIHYFHNKNYDTTNMVETLFCAKDAMSENVIVSYGDIVFQQNVLQKLMQSDDDFSVIVDKNWYAYWKVRFQNPLDDAESLLIDESGFITNIGQKVTSLDSIMGQYIGLMKFQGTGLEFLKKHYEDLKETVKNGKNPLNPNLPFEKSYMTDLLNYLITANCKLKAIPINNGWLELDTINDYNLYEKMRNDNSLNKFYVPDL